MSSFVSMVPLQFCHNMLVVLVRRGDDNFRNHFQPIKEILDQFSHTDNIFVRYLKEHNSEYLQNIPP